MHIIPIAPATLDILEVLNNGVRPVLEHEETFFVYKGKDEPPAIIDRQTLELSFEDEWMTVVKICYKGK